MVYTDRNCKILNKDFTENYIASYREFYIKTIYGDSLVLGETLVQEENNE